MAQDIDKSTARRRLGDIGENIACDFLQKHGFEVIERNYLRKWGEIDIVAKKGGAIRFIEVKSVSCVTAEVRLLHHSGPSLARVTLGTLKKGVVSSQGVRPEDNMHPGKLRRLARTIQTYLLHKKLECEWQLDLVTVKMDMKTRHARVELIENIII